MSYIMEPTKKNFLKLIEEEIAQYESFIKEEGYDLEQEPAVNGALQQLKSLKQKVGIRISEGTTRDCRTCIYGSRTSTVAPCFTCNEAGSNYTEKKE